MGEPTTVGEVFLTHRHDERGSRTAEGRQRPGCGGNREQHRERVVLLLRMGSLIRRALDRFVTIGRRALDEAGPWDVVHPRVENTVESELQLRGDLGHQVAPHRHEPVIPRRPTVKPRLRSARDSAGSAPS